MREVLSIAKALSDKSRLRALLALREGELCVCQIIGVLGLSPATVSKHMNLLQQAGLVERRTRGKWRYYRLADAHAGRAATRALEWLLGELKTSRQSNVDAQKLRKVRRQDLEELSACYRS